MRQSLTSQRLVAVFLVALLAFNYPVLAVFDRAAAWIGVPLLYLALFGAWALVIAAIAWVVEAGRR